MYSQPLSRLRHSVDPNCFGSIVLLLVLLLLLLISWQRGDAGFSLKNFEFSSSICFNVTKRFSSIEVIACVKLGADLGGLCGMAGFSLAGGNWGRSLAVELLFIELFRLLFVLRWRIGGLFGGKLGGVSSWFGDELTAGGELLSVDKSVSGWKVLNFNCWSLVRLVLFGGTMPTFSPPDDLIVAIDLPFGVPETLNVLPLVTCFGTVCLMAKPFSGSLCFSGGTLAYGTFWELLPFDCWSCGFVFSFCILVSAW